MGRTKGTKEAGWGHGGNIYDGCSNNCRYCYAKVLRCYQYKQILPQQWSEMNIKLDIHENWRQKWGNPKQHPDNRYMIPTAHDITLENWQQCFSIIKDVLHRGYNVLLVTKPRLDVISYAIPFFYDYKSQIEFRFTITSCDEDLLKFWEPEAPSFEERMKCLKLLAPIYKVSTVTEPFLDFDPLPLIQKLRREASGDCWIGIMNHIPEIKKMMQDQGIPFPGGFEDRYGYENLWGIYRALEPHPKVKFKDTFKEILRERYSNLTIEETFVPASQLRKKVPLETKLEQFF